MCSIKYFYKISVASVDMIMLFLSHTVIKCGGLFHDFKHCKIHNDKNQIKYTNNF